jgi:hypothetical protein
LTQAIIANNPQRMPIPALTKKGLLPPGIHACTLEEAEAAFARRPPQPGRAKLWGKFQQYLSIIRPIGIIQAVYIDGGFTSNFARAKDIDIVLEIPQPGTTIAPILKRVEFDRDHVFKKYKIDLWLWWDGIPCLPNDLRKYFQYVNPKDAPRLGLTQNDRKGILRVAL